MKFTTEVNIEPSAHRIRVEDSMLLLGSCFAQEMGAWFLNRKFSVCLNPNGILFHPSVIARCIRRALSKEQYNEADLISHDGMYHCFDHHGCWSNADPMRLLKNVNEQQNQLNHYLKNSKTMVVTWGSAWGYKWKEDNRWVANCHKIPQGNFEKNMLDAPAIVDDWSVLLEDVRKMNPSMHVIVSVSPVRYWRDGAHGNQLSKASLLLAASQLVSADQRVHYFPAYEIMMDELRDYRFYKEDMLHPSPVAVEFIIEKFQTMFFEGDAMKYIREIEPIVKFLNHRPLHVDSENWKKRYDEKEIEWEGIRKSYQEKSR